MPKHNRKLEGKCRGAGGVSAKGEEYAEFGPSARICVSWEVGKPFGSLATVTILPVEEWVLPYVQNRLSFAWTLALGSPKIGQPIIEPLRRCGSGHVGVSSRHDQDSARPSVRMSCVASGQRDGPSNPTQLSRKDRRSPPHLPGSFQRRTRTVMDFLLPPMTGGHPTSKQHPYGLPAAITPRAW